MTTERLRPAWLTLAGISIAVGLGTAGLTEWLRLDACHLCIFQRLLILLFGTLALAAALTTHWRGMMVAFGGVALCLSLAGASSAAYQSWIQMQPAGDVTCISGDPGAIELVVEWLGQHVPSLFLATGFCEDAGFAFLGLSLANWSLIAFVALTAASGLLLLRSTAAPHR